MAKHGIMLGTGHKSNLRVRHKKKTWWEESNYSAKTYHLGGNNYQVSIHRNGTAPVGRNKYITYVTAKSPASAYTKVINTPDFKRWKRAIQARIIEGKERTDYRM